MNSQGCIILLQAVSGVARAVRSLYGPHKLRKQVTDERYLEQTRTLWQACCRVRTQAPLFYKKHWMNSRQTLAPCSCTTMVTLCGVLAEAVMELLRQGLNPDVIQRALSTVMTCCLKTSENMRVPLSEAVPSLDHLPWTQQLEAVGSILSTRSIAANLAVKAASILDPSQFCGDDVQSLSDLVTTQVVLGGVTSATSSRAFNGILLPVAETSLRTALSVRLASTSSLTIDKGVVILAGNLDAITFPLDRSIQVIFVHGEISTRTIDAFVACPNSSLCIPVASYGTLRQLAELSGAQVVEAWKELVPHAIGHECLEVKIHEVSVSKVYDEKNDEVTTLYVQVLSQDTMSKMHASILVQGPTKSLALELQTETLTMINRLRNTLRSKFVLPGNGSFWCACAAAVKLEAERLASSSHELLSVAIAHLTNSFIQLNVLLLENSTDDSYFARLARVRLVQEKFARSVRDVGATKFYARYYDFRNTKYMVLLTTLLNAESELLRVDEYESKRSAIQRAFRVIQLLLNIDRHHIN